MKNYLFAALIIFTAVSAFGETGNRGFDKESELVTFSEEIISLIVKDNAGAACDKLKPFWPIPETEIDNIKTQTIKQLNMVKPRFGKTLSYFFFDQKNVKDTFVKLTYVIKYENHVTRWIFIYYRADNMWQLNNFKWDDKIGELVK